MIQVKIHGLGGQGVVTAALILAEAVAIVYNKHAQMIPAYGHARRGAPVYADVVIDDSAIRLKSFVYNPNYVVLFDRSVVNQNVDIMAGTTDRTVFIVNAEHISSELPFSTHARYFVDADRIALETLGTAIPNSAMLGAMAAAGLVGIESVKDCIGKAFGNKSVPNVAAAQSAYEQLGFIARSPQGSRQPPCTLPSPKADDIQPTSNNRKYLYGPVATMFSSANTGAWRAVRPVVNLANCTYCQVCEKHCPPDVITITRSRAAKDFALDYTYCKGCGICAEVCPRQCIAMQPEGEK